MNFRASASWLGLLFLSAVAACTNGGGLSNVGGSGGGGGSPSPLPTSSAIGVDIPTGKIGVENDPVWGTVSGYTQQQTSQVLAFPPGATITITNLSTGGVPHTLNVIAQTKGPPPQWPASPSLSFSPSGNGVLGTNYASGTINPGKSVKVKLSNPGIYLIGCAFHYISNQMRDVIQVVAGATPGPTASPGVGSGAVKPPAPVAAAARQPHLIDQRGRSFTLESLRGEPVVVTFVSAHCTDACPLIDAQFSDAARRIQAQRRNAKLVTITLDPQNDSPRTMRDLATRFEANPRYWLLAGGSVRNVENVMREFGVISKKGRDGYREEHTTFVYFFNPDGTLAQTMLASSNLSDSIVEGVTNRPEMAVR
ncbi:MAG: SCO family protein [Candidatus Eremiobacteraeota bacterium]|nr:SCO family protein [Candidatus Eremiobacteraeota bacterium]